MRSGSSWKLPPPPTSTFLDTVAQHGLRLFAGISGSAVVMRDGVRRFGDVPSVEGLRAIAQWLEWCDGDVFATDSFSRDARDLGLWNETPAGLLAVPVARDLGEFVMWFRHHPARTDRESGSPRPRKLELWAPAELSIASNLRHLALAAARHELLELRDEVLTLRGELERLEEAHRAAVAAKCHEPP